ncbi:hypothetical protein SPRG_13649 [Saprolegnia parasitica CBS 223.65]|uniref:Zinc/iron permease n=1 Tax=Saprolegnia parasitica (strain CBS 223.65) TaxID=695850 RepID=A0A067BQR1_SAPPC|nr:hypothetical protein SPRG_13649 [Saprolegnia parasitica CBS 223.65]KDO20834.1 hypothetical protein SPRG_13649 [Saprolegnia parasitica CBS 223.65]|eukprot:XP_012208492.1 hypothetical protein SPRG_13649 [Saprolegnia parasitica CBS 223.65]
MATTVTVNFTCGGPRDSIVADLAEEIASVPVIFLCSLAGSMLPVLSSYLACLRNSRKIMECFNALGFGVVVSTAFIHIIPPAMRNLDSPCLDLPYKGLAMVIVLATIYIMQLLETELVIAMSRPSPSEMTLYDDPPAMLAKDDHYDDAESPLEVRRMTRLPVSTTVAHAVLRQKITAVIFEVGVAIHSVLIGLELGVADGDTFLTLWIALCCHQFFEGVAVGTSSVSAFSGFKAALRTAFLFRPTSTTALWVCGVLEAIAGGILVYTGLVELVTYQYTINADFHAKSTPRRTSIYDLSVQM